MVSGLPNTQHISFLCSPSGNPSAAHAKESAEFCPTQSSPSRSNSSPPNRPLSPPTPTPQEASPPGHRWFPGQGPSFSLFTLLQANSSPPCSEDRSYLSYRSSAAAAYKLQPRKEKKVSLIASPAKYQRSIQPQEGWLWFT